MSSDNHSDITTLGSTVNMGSKCSLNDLSLDHLGVYSKWNFFEIVTEVETQLETTLGCKLFDTLYSKVESTATTDSEREILQQSYRAFLAVGNTEDTRIANMMNGDIVTDSESDNPEALVGQRRLSEKMKAVVVKRRAAIKRQKQRYKAKLLVEKRLLSRKVTKTLHGVLLECPGIGKEIEAFVSERNVGADAWRRTGVLTFGGNKRIKEKVTYERIRQHLQQVYNRKFSYGTVVQLCVARNKRRRSSKNYKGIAKVTTRRSRKGFTLKYNPDSHWSAALYKGLNWLQFTDGTDILNINRDDASGFRLDTMVTHSQHSCPMVQGEQVVTTHTDYVNKYPSTLQTTSYNFTESRTTPELCAGVVKASKIYPKNPSQHSADLNMLETSPELQTAFQNPTTGTSKGIECIRVDGAGDEGPSHLEVRYLWTERHLNTGSLATLVSARCSGCSYLNRVELQNGCLALAHANLFIPSTLKGSCLDVNTGGIDHEKLKANLQAAMDIYIQRCNHAPCGDTQIMLFKGADSSNLQERREDLITFLKGSCKAKSQLKAKKPELYGHFQTVWALRERHMVKNLPSQYLFYLLPCYKSNCPHPVCQSGRPTSEVTWFDGGPPLTYLPLPVPDKDRPWGGSCDSCYACCSHYLDPRKAVTCPTSVLSCPPSAVILKFFNSLKGAAPSEQQLEAISRQVLLPCAEVKMWLDHLSTVQQNRKRGAAKAAETRKRKAQQTGLLSEAQNDRCGVCGEEYEETPEEELWIECSTCMLWFHADCVGINPSKIPEVFICHCCLSS